MDPTLTVVETTHYSTSNIPFPALTICDTQIVYGPATNNITNLLILRGYNETEVEEFYGSFSKVKLKDYSPEPFVRKIHSLLDDLGYSWEIMLAQLRKPCEELINDCTWRSKLHNCSTMFRSVFTIVGYCCQFDIPYFRAHAGKSTNYVSGVEITEALNVMVDVQKDSLASGYLSLYVYDHQDEITLLDSPITLTPGAYFDVNVYLWAIDSSPFVAALPMSVRKCIAASDERVSAAFYQGCMSHLILRRVVNHCRCLPFQFKAKTLGVEDFPSCTWERLLCIYQMIEKTEVDIRGIIADSECYQRCDYVQYETEVEFIKNHRLSTVVNETSSRVSVHFADTTCMKYRREVLYTWDQMLANLGGIFGLCLGGSIISLLEIVWFLLDLLQASVKSLRKTTVTTPNTNIYHLRKKEIIRRKLTAFEPRLKFLN
ncbi:sodium channel protein Nach [Bombyx mori]